MLTFRQYITELKITRLLTVAPDNLKPGEDLKSLNTLHGKKKGEKIEKQKWPVESNKTTKSHAKYVHLDKPEGNEKVTAGFSLASMRDFPNAKQKLALYDVRPGRHMGKVEQVPMSYGHSGVKGHIPGKYVRNKWDEKTQAWKRWK